MFLPSQFNCNDLIVIYVLNCKVSLNELKLLQTPFQFREESVHFLTEMIC